MITYEERQQGYTNALIAYGEEKQCIVALEELSECAKEICKVLRGKGDREHLAEEIADARICLEQMIYFFFFMRLGGTSRLAYEGDTLSA